MDGNLPQVSVVFPVYNEEGNLELLYQHVHDALSIAGVSYEMVFVDNGSKDGSLAIIKGLSERDPSVPSCFSVTQLRTPRGTIRWDEVLSR